VSPPGRECFVGVDFGTSGVRACAIDWQGATLAEVRASIPSPLSPASRQVEQEPQLWWDACLRVLDELFLENDLSPLALSIDGTSGTLLLCDVNGEPIGPALMYNDSRAIEEAKALTGIAPPEAAVHSPSSALAKLCHLLQQPGAADAHYALHQADWITSRLTGHTGVSDENNALKLGYDPVHRTWPAWLMNAPIDMALLPAVLPVGDELGLLRDELRRRWKLSHPVRIIAGTTDSNAATLACGINEIGQAATALGSTLVVKVISDKPVYDGSYGVYSHRLGNRWLVGGASNSGGSVLLQHFTKEQLSELSHHIKAENASGLNYYPLPDKGERFPVNDPELLPQLTPRPTNDVQYLHGLLEGIAGIEYRGYCKLQELGAPYPTMVVTSGGGASNITWSRIRERILGVPVSTAKHMEAAYGSALIAAGKLL